MIVILIITLLNQYVLIYITNRALLTQENCNIVFQLFHLP
ncbi:hypothetical protein DES54_13812 [Brenneria salicis ATCC 15712 = DSM 30166]|uniref:Uncharacterized protein n=1 Tax=Brenneria salicis ATCC 15712 = DSM 30166 TaxID=714314 RepID=A0A366HZM7_9GAMM|nr:hypothetical protein DES54_13812 [Brenneria salicis ATCC 15712 = DSM 30166]